MEAEFDPNRRESGRNATLSDISAADSGRAAQSPEREARLIFLCPHPGVRLPRKFRDEVTDLGKCVPAEERVAQPRRLEDRL